MKSPLTWQASFIVWLRIGLISFGGPAAQIALMHREIVEQKRWLSEQQYLNALSFCMLLPGPEAMQLATYTGWKLQGILGGLLAGLLFVLPGACIILLLSAIYMLLGEVSVLDAIFYGIKAAVIAIVLQALYRVSKKSLTNSCCWIIACLAFVGIFFLAIPFPLIILLAALWGFFSANEEKNTALTPLKNHVPELLQTLSTLGVCLLIWWLPLLVVGFWFADSILLDLGLFFSKLAVVTFGGAYAVLSYMAQDVVTHYSWLSAQEMIDGLALAESTPGPLILVTEFVGFIAAANQGGVVLGLLGAAVALWATFAPCFVWIFTFAPYIERLSHHYRFGNALLAITAAVVGVILNLFIWFGLHVIFGGVNLVEKSIFSLWMPDFTTLDMYILGLILINAALLLLLRINIVLLFATAAVLGILIKSPFILS